MAWELHAYKVDNDGEIRVKHTFYGSTKAECEENFEAHVEICPKFGPAEKAGDVISVFEECDEIPTRESVERELVEEEDGEEEDDDEDEDDEDE